MKQQHQGGCVLGLCGITRWTLGASLLLLCGVAWAADPPSDGDGGAKKPDKQKVVYLEEVWKYLGPSHNAVLADKTWKILDNTGKVVLSVPSEERNGYHYTTVGSSSDQIFVRELSPKLGEKAQNIVLPKTQGLVLPMVDGKGGKRFLIPTYDKVFIQPAMDVVIVHGKNVLNLEPWGYVETPVAFSLKTEERIQGELPAARAVSLEFVSRPDWNTLFLITGGDRRKRDNPLTLIRYDKDLKKIFSHTITAKGQRHRFARTTKDALYAVVTTPDRKWTFVYFNVKTGKLSFPPFDVPRTSSLRGCLVSGENVVIWSSRHITFYNPKTPKTRRSIQPPKTKGSGLGAASAVAEDGRFVLTRRYFETVPGKLLVYTSEGKLIEQIPLKPGSIEHLKFVSGGKELLVFARKYTARVQLNPPAATEPSTPPATTPPPTDPKKGK